MCENGCMCVSLFRIDTHSSQVGSDGLELREAKGIISFCI